jgi:hypothetical protein
MAIPYSNQDIDLIATKIVLDAREAMNRLAAFSKSTTDAQQRLDVLKRIVAATAAQMGGDLGKAEKAVRQFANSLTGIRVAEIKQVSRELRQIDASTKAAFAGLGAAPTNVSARINILAQAIKNFSVQGKISIEQVTQSLIRMNAAAKPGTFGKLGFSNQDILRAGQAAQQLGAQVKQVGSSSIQAGNDMENAFKKALSPINAVRIALGAIVAMIVFQVIQAFGRMFSMALKGLNEMEAAMYNLVNAEKRLSEQGFEVSVEGLEKLIEDLQKLDPMLSKFQATELVSTLATKVAPVIGLTQKEVERLARSIVVLAVQNQALGKSFEEVQQQVITGLLSGRVTAGINQLGTKITEQRVQEEALALQLVKTAEAYSELSAREKERIDTLAIISILEKDTAQQAESLPAFLQTASGLIGTAKAEFQDLLTTLGQKFAPVVKEIVTGIIGILQRINRSLEEDAQAWNSLVTLLTMGAKAVMVLAQLFVDLSVKIGWAGRALFNFLSMLPGVGSTLKNLFPDEPFPDTPTSGSFDIGEGESIEKLEKRKEAIKDFEEDVIDIMEDARDRRLEIERDYQRKLEDIARDYGQKLEDIARDTAQKREDALRDYNQKVEDINRDANQAIIDAQEDYRQKEIDREQEYQNRLRELRDKFLFDLEDALRERDARAVLRLIRQYNLDKKNLEEKKKLDEQEAKESLERKLEEIERDRQLKLEAARREYEEKLAEIAIGERRALQEAALWRKRQLEDARIWHQRQLEEYRKYLQKRLQDLAAALAKELDMNAAAAAAIASMISALTGVSIPAPSPTSPSTGFGTNPYFPGFGSNPFFPGFNTGFYAEGGTLIARKPTMAVFGEQGDEMVSFTPLNRRGRNVGQVFGDRVGAGMGGSLSMRIGISEGLVAEIVETSLENVATHIEHIRRQR